MIHKNLFRLSLNLLMAVLVLAGVGVQAQCVASGDVNGDGLTLTSGDLVLFAQSFASGNFTEYLWEYDLNGDCVVNGLDLDILMDYWAGGGPIMPVETCCDPDIQLCGAFTQLETGNVDYDGDGVRDLSDILMLASYAFLDGDPPFCMADMNVDGDAGCVYDLGDVLMLASFAYLDGDAPAFCMLECEQ